MRETPQTYRRRSGASYQPPGWLQQTARPLRRYEACPTLFRYPGPCGLETLFADQLRHLGPVPGATLWMSAMRTHADVSGARHFGTVVLLRPLRLSPCLTPRRGIYVAVNRALEEDEIAWLPPSALRARLPWDRIRSRDEAEARLEPWATRDRSRVQEELGCYLEELRGLESAGAPAPHRPWCDVSLSSRRRLLTRYGMSPRWSRR